MNWQQNAIMKFSKIFVKRQLRNGKMINFTRFNETRRANAECKRKTSLQGNVLKLLTLDFSNITIMREWNSIDNTELEPQVKLIIQQGSCMLNSLLDAAMESLGIVG